MWIEIYKHISEGTLRGDQVAHRNAAWRSAQFGTLPGLALALSGGTGMLWINPALLTQGWVWVKFVALALMLAVTVLQWEYTMCGMQQRRFSDRTFHAIVGTLLLLILLLATLRPF